jgi:ribosome maturation factor RimP
MKRSPVKSTQLSPDTVKEIEAAVFHEVEQRLAAQFYLLDVVLEKEAGHWYLRVYVENTSNPISLSECEAISRELEPVIDEMSQLNDFSYSFEISSPGVFRPLKRQREFDFYVGKPVRVEAAQSQAKGGKKPPVIKNRSQEGVQEGILQGYNAERNLVILQRADGEQTFEVSLDDAKVVYLNPVIHIPDEDEAPENTDN